MARETTRRPQIGVKLTSDVEYLENRPTPYRARVRWIDPETRERRSLSNSCVGSDEAQDWIDRLVRLAEAGISPATAAMSLGAYGDHVMDHAVRGLEKKTLDPYLAGWRKRVKPDIGHLMLPTITTGVVDRAVHGWIADGQGR